MTGKKDQFTKEEEIKVKETAPLEQQAQVVTTKRKTPIKRHLIPLGSENYGMTTDSGRFKETQFL